MWDSARSQLSRRSCHVGPPCEHRPSCRRQSRRPSRHASGSRSANKARDGPNNKQASPQTGKHTDNHSAVDRFSGRRPSGAMPLLASGGSDELRFQTALDGSLSEFRCQMVAQYRDCLAPRTSTHASSACVACNLDLAPRPHLRQATRMCCLAGVGLRNSTDVLVEKRESIGKLASFATPLGNPICRAFGPLHRSDLAPQDPKN